MFRRLMAAWATRRPRSNPRRPPSTARTPIRPRRNSRSTRPISRTRSSRSFPRSRASCSRTSRRGRQQFRRDPHGERHEHLQSSDADPQFAGFERQLHLWRRPEQHAARDDLVAQRSGVAVVRLAGVHQRHRQGQRAGGRRPDRAGRLLASNIGTGILQTLSDIANFNDGPAAISDRLSPAHNRTSCRMRSPRRNPRARRSTTLRPRTATPTSSCRAH